MTWLTGVMETPKEVACGSEDWLLIRKLRKYVNMLEITEASLSLLEKGVINMERGKG